MKSGHRTECVHMLSLRADDDVLTKVWLSVCSEVHMICIWSSWCHRHLIISCFRMVYLSGASLPRL